MFCKIPPYSGVLWEPIPFFIASQQLGKEGLQAVESTATCSDKKVDPPWVEKFKASSFKCILAAASKN